VDQRKKGSKPPFFRIIHKDNKLLERPERLKQEVKGQGSHLFNVGVVKEIICSYIVLTEVKKGELFVRKIGLWSNKIKQMQKHNIEDTQYKRDTYLRGSPSVGYVHQRNCQVLSLLLSVK
jgi:hypothetical protein